MKKIKTIAIIYSAIIAVACNQNFSDKEKELLSDSIKEAVNNVNEQNTRSKGIQNNKKHPEPFCDLMPESLILSVLPDAKKFTRKRIKERTPQCEITFESGKELIPGSGRFTPGGILIKGVLPRKNQTSRTFLENFMETNKSGKKIENLGDESYIFSDYNSSYVITINDYLCYTLRLNIYGDEGADKKAIALMQGLVNNL